MATFRVRLRREAGREITDLPPVCARCGAPATHTHSTSFFFNWKRQRVTLPLCEKHWLRRKLRPLVSVGYFCLVFSLIGAMCWVRVLVQPSDAFVTAYWIVFVAFVGCFATVRMVLHFRRILPVRITDDYIELKNVSTAFAKAVEADEEEFRQRFIRDAEEPFAAPPRQDDRIQPGDSGCQRE